jgi:hypothetical protein
MAGNIHTRLKATPTLKAKNTDKATKKITSTIKNINI